MQKQTLQQIFAEIGNHSGIDAGGNDKNSTHTYLETYDRLFEPFRDKATILEIGLATGDSIKLWNRYFQTSVIVGVDLSIVFEPPTETNNHIYLIAADATKPDIVEILDNECWKDCKFNIIIDDGSHMTADQIQTFNLLKGNMNPGGIYVIEDILALDQERWKFEALHDNCEIVDMRSNGRFDNVLIIYRF